MHTGEGSLGWRRGCLRREREGPVQVCGGQGQGEGAGLCGRGSVPERNGEEVAGWSGP